MNNCLVFQGISEINNPYAREIGEMRIKIVSAGGGVTAKSAANSGNKLKILTPGVTFTNSGFVGETEQTVSNAGERNCTVSAPCEIAIYDKYNLAVLRDSSYYLEMDINELSYANNMTSILIKDDSSLTDSIGDINVLHTMTKLTDVSIYSKHVTGDLQNLPEAPNLWGLKFSNADGARHANITGDIANVANKFGALVDVYLVGTDVYGSIESFSGKYIDTLRDVLLANTQVSGQISGFANHSALRQLQLGNTNVTGNFGQLVNVPALAGLWVPSTVTYTSADATRIDALLESNGATIRPDGHYFAGGTLVENY